ncbi:MAG TPA: xylulokinase [Ilumatobacter sp.]|nr:xylulokinase [Ilumatobacter sp.]
MLGVDSSTQSVKVEARDITSGRVVATASVKHPPTSPPVSEQDPTAWWSALVEAFGSLPIDVRAAAVAMSVAGQQHGLVLLDADGAPVRPAKLWNDTTSAPQADSMVAALGGERWAQLTGTCPVAAITVTKLAWVGEHEPDSLARVSKVMLPHDYLTWMLTGEHVTDRGDASGTGWFDAESGAYVPEAFRAAGLDPDTWVPMLPRVLGATEVAGTIREDAAAALGLPAGVIVGPGSGDNMGAALGLGLSAGDVAVSLGTSGTVFAVSSTPTRDPSGAVAGFASATGDYLPLVCTLNATKVTDTVARWLGTDASGLANLAMAATRAPGDVMLVPYFDGERTPNLPDATGTFVGLTNATSREQLALAAHDGVLCGLLDGIDALRAVGAACNGRLFLVGGGARSVAYRQRLADLSGQPVVVPHTDETVATGAAVQAAVVANEEPFADVVGRWKLGAGDTVWPAIDAWDRRARYAADR